MTTRPALLRTPGGRLTAAALTAVLGAGLGACQVASPITTDISYDPADGVSAAVAGVTVSDLLVVTEAEGQPARVSGLVSNSGSEPVTVVLSLEDRTELANIEVAPGQSVRLDGEPVHGGSGGDPVRIEEVSGGPGQFLTLRVGVEGGGTVSAEAPILAPSGPYADLTVEEADSTAGAQG